MSNMSSKYNKDSNTILLGNTNQFYTFINEIGGDIDMKAYKPLLSMWSYRENGDKIELIQKRDTPSTLAKFNEWYNLDLNLEECKRIGGAFYLAFNSVPDLQDTPEEESEESFFSSVAEAIQETAENVASSIADSAAVVSEQVSETIEDVTDKVEDVVEKAAELTEDVVEKVTDVVDDVVDTISEVEVPNWKKLSSPTTGKKKLKEAAEEAGIELKDGKYKDMVAEFKEKFEESSRKAGE